MGNKVSCVMPSTMQTATARVMSPDGELRLLEIPVGVAELMIEATGHVVARASDVVNTRRVVGMRADEELSAGELYLVLPVDKVGTRVSDGQLAYVKAAIEGKKTNKRKKVTGKRVVPVAVDNCEGEKRELKGDSDLDVKKVSGLGGQRVGRFQQWRPKLEIIHE